MATRIAAAGLVLLFLTGCVTHTSVYFESNVEDATVYLDGQPIGQTPFTARLSNALWENPDVLIEAEGYQTLRTDLQKEVKVGNLISGLLLIWPALLWVYGPESNQYFRLVEE